MDDIDNMMDVLDAIEAKKQTQEAQSRGGRTLIGKVDHFFDKINVVAIRLTDKLQVGDTIELENEEYAVRQRVESMQINRKDVLSASSGDDVGVKLSVPVPRGSLVYRLG